MRPDPQFNFLAVLGLIFMAVTVFLMLAFQLSPDQASGPGWELCVIGFVALELGLTGLFWWSVFERVGLGLGLLGGVALLAVGIYWGLTALGLGPRSARLVVWVILAAAFFGMQYLIGWLADRRPDLVRVDADVE